MKKDKISIVVPCYNEEESLPIFYKEINRISKEMSECDFELLFINTRSKRACILIGANLLPAIHFATL